MKQRPTPIFVGEFGIKDRLSPISPSPRQLPNDLLFTWQRRRVAFFVFFLKPCVSQWISVTNCFIGWPHRAELWLEALTYVLEGWNGLPGENVQHCADSCAFFLPWKLNAAFCHSNHSRERKKKNLQIDVENTGTFAFGCKRAGGEMLAPSAASEGSCLFVHVFASFNALFLKSSR